MANRFCIYCGQDLPDNVNYCPNCGRGIINSADASTVEETKKKKLIIAVLAVLLVIGGAILGGVPEYISSSMSERRAQQIKELLNEESNIYKEEVSAQKLSHGEYSYGKWSSNFDKCEKLLVNALEKAETDIQKLTIHNNKMHLYHSGGDKEKAVAEAKTIITIIDGTSEKLPEQYYRLYALEEIIKSAKGKEKYEAAINYADELLKYKTNIKVLKDYGITSLHGLIGGCMLPVVVHKDVENRELAKIAARKSLDILEWLGRHDELRGEDDPTTKRLGLITSLVGGIVSSEAESMTFWKDKFEHYNSRETLPDSISFGGDPILIYNAYNSDEEIPLENPLEQSNSKEPHIIKLREIDNLLRQLMLIRIKTQK